MTKVNLQLGNLDNFVNLKIPYQTFNLVVSPRVMWGSQIVVLMHIAVAFDHLTVSQVNFFMNINMA